MRQKANAGTSATPGDAVPDVGWRRQRRWWPTGRRREDRGEGAAALTGSGHPGSVPNPPRPARRRRGRPDWRAREGAGAPERARQATADRAPRGGCSALHAGRLLPLVCNDRLGGLDMRGGNYLHWFMTAPVNSHLKKLGPGDGFRTFSAFSPHAISTPERGSLKCVTYLSCGGVWPNALAGLSDTRRDRTDTGKTTGSERLCGRTRRGRATVPRPVAKWPHLRPRSELSRTLHP